MYQAGDGVRDERESGTYFLVTTNVSPEVLQERLRVRCSDRNKECRVKVGSEIATLPSRYFLHHTSSSNTSILLGRCETMSNSIEGIVLLEIFVKIWFL